MNKNSSDASRRTYLKLLHSGLFQVYQKAFETATGLPLLLRFSDDPNEEIKVRSENESLFCRLLRGGQTCEACRDMRNCLARDACDRTSSAQCFAGMQETMIPVRLGRNTIAFLQTGEVFVTKPTKKSFANVARVLVEEGRTAEDVEKLRESYFKGQVMGKERYRSMVTLLNAFSLQLADLANRIVLERQGAEPSVVRKAKSYILDNLDEPIRLDDVAQHVHVSAYYFCKIFKQATGITFTEFVNRQRVERAKKMLLNPETRVTEVAYEVGFQSLSQFNRSFLKIVGDSPTEFRRRMMVRPRLAVA